MQTRIKKIGKESTLADIKKLANDSADEIIKKMQSQPKKEKIEFPKESICDDGTISIGDDKN